ncbi:MAG: FAD-binding oxidoreductase [Anaerolineales bacterium]|nr:FAD-binding oxidoreductase [Anaerolineales bacterium]
MEYNPVPTWTASTLQKRISGQVIEPGDPSYDQARSAWNLSVDQKPALIVIPENVADLIVAVEHATDAGIGVAVQATGHGVSQPADGRMLILTRAMKEVRINPVDRTAWIEAGARWGEVLEKSQRFGLAPLLGSSPDVGAIGYTLGGGMGWLARKFGLAVDSVRRFELVAATGDFIQASPSENPDLFWGLRGGGGGLGIVTRMEVDLYPVSRVYGGNLFYPASIAGQVYRRYREWIETVPDELTSSIVLMNYPPTPELPEPLRGQSFIIVRGCFCGPILNDGVKLLQYWRDWQAPLMDEFKPMPFSDVAAISNDPPDPVPGRSTSAWLSGFHDEAIEALIDYGFPGPGGPPLAVTEVRHAGGAIARVDPETTAYSLRQARHLLQLIGITPTPDLSDQLVQYTTALLEALEPHLDRGVYMNFLEGEESRRRVREGFSTEAYNRLAELKARYDPDRRLHAGFAIH